ncbi:MAG: diguanylate cyclase [Rhodoferax sp.]|uniref:GGDEF domain-containing response regulator n=1 Tax=Rhodoferax sp. TaxID=50421 RepID=UPI0027194E12|nr:diguanylate cyclase [Rhodoferax sp.]MDO8447492.1 diguanylate cyclase [Rhodoferax sp.]
MSCPPAELKKKSDELRVKWDAFIASPSFGPFVEFAVCLSSFSEFLSGKGLSGLHQLSHGLEQQALSLFDEAARQQIPPGTLDDLRSQVEGLAARIDRFIDSNSRPVADRRAQPDAATASDLTPTHRIWLIGKTTDEWRALVTQLAYFGIQAEVYPWDNVPAQAKEPAILLLDTQGIVLEDACQHIKALRARFSASKLIAYQVAPDFNAIKAALGAGCDFCFADGTPQPVILAKVIELCSNEEEAPYRVLVVEDSLTASKSIQRTLKQNGIESLAVTRPHEVLTGLRSFAPDLILMDMYMPDCTGVEATRVIRQHAEFLSTPVIYLSGDGDIALQVDALRLGGEHFLTKPFNPVFLNAVVKSKIERYRALRRAMLHDSLTGLLNHATSKERLAAAVNTAKGANGPLAVAMIDIDHFKKINDNYGHPMGDQVIRSLAWLLKQRLRKTDIVGRYGGEEFLVVLPGSNADQAFDVLDRIRRDFSLIKYAFKDTCFEATFSAGVSHFPATACPHALIKDADEALYDAKHGGRNCVITRR